MNVTDNNSNRFAFSTINWGNYMINYPYKIAIVEDNEVELNMIKQIVSKDNRFEVLEFSNPIEAFDAIEKEEVRVIFTDLQMEALNGEELLSKVNELQRGVICFVMTGTSNYITANSCLNAGVRNILLKPIRPQTIRESLNEAASHLERWQNIIMEVLEKKKAG